MLKPEEQQVFASLVARLHTEDPEFAARAERLARPPLRWTILGILLWTVAPLCIIFGGWTGVIEAVIAAAYGAHLIRRRQRWMTAVSASGRR